MYIGLILWIFMSSIIYHYCSPDGFFKIIETKTLRLTDTCFMNDTSEGLLFRAYFQEWIYNKIQCPKELKDKIFESVFVNTEPSLVMAFCTCFSREVNSLNMWKHYANQCQGFAIGFNTSLLTPLTNTMPRMMAGNSIRLSLLDVVYSKEKVMSILDNQLRSLIESADRIHKYDNDAFSLILQCISICSEFLSPAVKHPCFGEEHEVRLIYKPLDVCAAGTPSEKVCFQGEQKSVAGMEKLSVSNVRFLADKTGLRQFYNLDFSQMPELIREVHVGANNMTRPETLSLFLHKNGITPELFKQIQPVRRE